MNVPNNLSNLESEADQLNIKKLETILADLSKLSKVVKKNFGKKTEYDDLVRKVNVIKTTDTNDLIKKIDHITKIHKIDNKIIDHDHGNKYITRQEFKKTYFGDKLKKINKKITSNEKNHVLVENELRKLDTFD